MECVEFTSLTQFKKELLDAVNKKYPKETKKFIKNQARKCSKLAKKIAKQEIGTNKGKRKDWVDTKSYHKRFDSSSVYEKGTGEICCKAFNNARHAKLIEFGHLNVPRGEGKNKSPRRSGKSGTSVGFTQGKFIMKKAEMQYINTFQSEAEEFLYTFLGNMVK